MNPELIRLLDQYLNNELSPEDTQIVADRIANDPNLKLELDRMMNIRATAKRAAQRNEIVTTAKSFHFMKNVKSVALGAAIVAALTFGVIAIVNKVRDSKDTASSINKELALKYDEQKAMEFVPSEYFQLTGEDTVVLSKNGVLLSVPSGAFLQNGVPYTKAVVVQFQEAMDDATIVKGGLSTMAGDRLLETQGMFGLKAFDENGKLLEMNPKIGVTCKFRWLSRKKECNCLLEYLMQKAT